MEERHSKDLCYNCDEVYTRGHQCKWLFWLEVEDEEEADLEIQQIPEQALDQQAPEISLHAMNGAPSPQTLQLGGTVCGKPIQVLIDTGSTHSFVDAQFASRLKFVLMGTRARLF